MSAFCLDLHSAPSSASALSAPRELDSDRMEPALDSGPPGAGGLEAPSLLRAPAGGLGTALEEELAMLTREREQEEEDAAELAAAETPLEQDVDLLALFRQKERDLVLAAKLGKALLERNQELTKQYEKMNKDLNEKLEVRRFHLSFRRP